MLKWTERDPGGYVSTFAQVLTLITRPVFAKEPQHQQLLWSLVIMDDHQGAAHEHRGGCLEGRSWVLNARRHQNHPKNKLYHFPRFLAARPSVTCNRPKKANIWIIKVLAFRIPLVSLAESRQCHRPMFSSCSSHIKYIQILGLTWCLQFRPSNHFRPASSPVPVTYEWGG